MQIDLTYDPSTAAAPAGFISALNYVVTLFDAMFTNDVTITIGVGWGEIDGQALDYNSLGESSTNYTGGNDYGIIRAALTANAQSSYQNSAYQYLPASDPTGGAGLDISNAEMTALYPWDVSPGSDGWVGFSSSDAFSFTPNTTPTAGEYDFIELAEHEITEVMGRTADGATIMNLFRYSAPGSLIINPDETHVPAYFSVDGGVTNLGYWNSHPAAGDTGDWSGTSQTAQNDAFDASGFPGEPAPLTLTDIELMSVLGWNLASPANTVPVGVLDDVYNQSTQSGIIVDSGGSQQVEYGGTAIDTVVQNGGELVVTGGGNVTGLTIASGGLEVLTEGASISGQTIGNGATLIVSSGTTASDIAVESGGILHVLSGGTATNVAAFGGSMVTADPGGIISAATGTVVPSGREETVGSGQVDVGDTILGGGTEIVTGGGVAIGTTVSSGGEIILGQGGTIDGLSLLAGGIEAIGSGATVTAGSGVVLSGLMILSGGTIVYGGGTAVDTLVAGGAHQIVASGATVSGLHVTGGGNLVVSSGSEAIAASVSGGAQLEVAGGGTAIDTTIGSGGSGEIQSGGVAGGTTIDGGGDLQISGGATASGITLATGGTLTLSGTGSVTGLALNAGGIIDAAFQEAGISATVNSSNQLIVASGGAVVDTIGLVGNNTGFTFAPVATSNGGIDFILSENALTGGMVFSGDSQTVSAGQAASGVLVNGGQQFVLAGASATGTTVLGGGTQIVESGGAASGTSVQNGGEIGIQSGATVTGLAVESGALIDLVNTSATGAAANDANQLVISSGGTVVETINLSGNGAGLTFYASADGNGGTELLVDRPASDQFDAAYYLAGNPDVAAAVAAGITTAYRHYLTYGQHEGRAPNGEFDPGYYLAHNPDVAAAVKVGAIASAFQHYVEYGIAEGRAGSAELAAFDASFNEAAYDAANPDVAAAVQVGLLKSGLEHYLLYGETEGRIATDASGQVITPGTILAISAASSPAAIAGNDTISVPGSILVYAGTGSQSFTAGSSKDVFVFDASRDQNGSATVQGFNPAQDIVQFANYSAAQLDAVTLPGALATETTGTGTVLSLPNGTTVTFVGVHLGVGNFTN